MRRGAAIVSGVACLVGIAMCPITSAAGQANAAPEREPVELAVVVHPLTPVDSLSLAELRDIFLGDRQFWPDQRRVTLLIHAPGTAERAALLRTVYQMSEPDFRRYWIAKVFRAEVAAGPKLVYSNDMAKRLVATVPGAIAILPVTAVDATLRVVAVEGRRPGQQDYPLR
jgi:phosphate transport system substrate-binding protein